MKRILLACIMLVAFTGVNAQDYNQNINYTQTAQFSGRTVVKDTAFIIRSGNDSIVVSISSDTAYITSTTAAIKFSPAPSSLGPVIDGNVQFDNNVSVEGSFTANGNMLIGGNFDDTVTIGTGIGKPLGTPLAVTPGGAIFPDTSCTGRKCVDSIYNGVSLSNGDIRLGGALVASTRIPANGYLFSLSNSMGDLRSGADTVAALPAISSVGFKKQIGFTRYFYNAALNLSSIGQDSTTVWLGQLSTLGTNTTRLTISPNLSTWQATAATVGDSTYVCNLLMAPGTGTRIMPITFTSKNRYYSFGFAGRDEVPRKYANIFYGIYPDSSGNNIKDITRVATNDVASYGLFATWNASYSDYRYNGFYAASTYAQLEYNKDSEDGQLTGHTWTIAGTGVGYHVNGTQQAYIDTTGIITAKNIRLAQSTQAYGGTVAQDTTVNLYVYTSSTGASTFNLSTTASIGTRVTIKDGIGEAASSNITVDSGGGNDIDSAQTYVISTNYGWVTVQKVSATLWAVIGKD